MSLIIFIILSFILRPIILDSFGPAEHWCWIKTGTFQWYVFMLYGIIIFVLLFNACGMLYAYRYLKKLETIGVLKQQSFFNKLRLYPIIFTIIWLFPTFNRYSTLIVGYQAEWTHIMHSFFESVIGFVNMILYALNPKVKAIIKQKLKALYKKKFEIDLQTLQEKKDNIHRTSTLAPTSFEEKQSEI